MWRRTSSLLLLPLLPLLAGNLKDLAVEAAAAAAAPPSSSSSSSSEPFFSASFWYDWGLYGPYPHETYESFGGKSPRPNLVHTDPRCDDDDLFVFIAPRGLYVNTPGPVILDNDGNLVWMETAWGQAMDLKVQQFQGRDFITFWSGSDTGTFGTGSYFMLDESYQVFKKFEPVGGFKGDLHEFHITKDGTALVTIYHKTQAQQSGQWIYDSLFQEIDIESGRLLFEWRASDHFSVEQSKASTSGKANADGAFDFFHINSIDKDAEGNFLISSRYWWSLICISHDDGSVLWQLGGDGNDFADLSDGAATNFSWNHHASWLDEGDDDEGDGGSGSGSGMRSNSTTRTLTIFDNGSNGEQDTAAYSRGLMLELDLGSKTATLLHSYVAPQKLLATSQGSVQALPNGNVLVGWGSVPAFTEFSRDGRQVLCDTHLGPVRLASLGWVKNYRAFKSDWVGRPAAPPDLAVRPGQQAVFASWNGATEVDAWVLQSAPSPDAEDDDDEAFIDHGIVPKATFETRISIPPNAREFLRVAALDADGHALGYSRAVSKHERTVTEPLPAPPRPAMPEPATLFALALFGLTTAVTALCRYRAIVRWVRRLWWRDAQSQSPPSSSSYYSYELLPTTR